MTVLENLQVALPAAVLPDGSRHGGGRAAARRRRPRRSTRGTGSRRSPWPSGTCSRSPRRSRSRPSCSSSTSRPRRWAGTPSTLFFQRVRGAGGRRHLRRLHHPPDGRGARARRPGHRAARRAACAAPARVADDHRRRAAGPDPRPPARLHLPAEARRGAATRPRACGSRTWPGPGFAGVSAHGSARARSSGWPASSATGRASLLRALAGLEPFTGTVTHRRAATAVRASCCTRPRTCRPTGTPRG